MANQTTAANTVSEVQNSSSSANSSTFFSLADAFNSASQAQPSVPEATDPFLNYINSLVQLVDTFPGKDSLRSTALPFKYEEPFGLPSINRFNEQKQSFSTSNTTPTAIKNKQVLSTVKVNNTIATTVTENVTSLQTIEKSTNAQPAVVTKAETPLQNKSIASFVNRTESTIAPEHITKPYVSSNSSVLDYVDRHITSLEQASINVSRTNESQIEVPSTPNPVVNSDMFALLGLDKSRVDGIKNNATDHKNNYLYHTEHVFTYSPLVKTKNSAHIPDSNIQVVPVQKGASNVNLGHKHQAPWTKNVFQPPVLSEFVGKVHTNRVSARPINFDSMFISTSVDPFLRFHNKNDKVIYNVEGLGKNHHKLHSDVEIQRLSTTSTQPTVNNVSMHSKESVSLNETVKTPSDKKPTLPFWLSLLSNNDNGIIRGQDGFVSYIDNNSGDKQQIADTNDFILSQLPPGLTLLSLDRNKKQKINNDKTNGKNNSEPKNNISDIILSLPDAFMAGTSVNIAHPLKKMENSKHQNMHMGHITTHNAHLNKQTANSIDTFQAAANTTAKNVFSFVTSASSSSTPPSTQSKFTQKIKFNLFVGTPDSITRKQHLNHSSMSHVRQNLFPPAHSQNANISEQENRTVLFPPKVILRNAQPEHNKTSRDALFPPVYTSETHKQHNSHEQHRSSGTKEHFTPKHSRMNHPVSHVPNIIFMHPQSRLTSHPQQSGKRGWRHSSDHSIPRHKSIANDHTVIDPQHHSNIKQKPVENLLLHTGHITNKSQEKHTPHMAQEPNKVNHNFQHAGHSSSGHKAHKSNARIHDRHPQSRNQLFDHSLHVTQKTVHKSHAMHQMAKRIEFPTTEASFDLLDSLVTATPLSLSTDTTLQPTSEKEQPAVEPTESSTYRALTNGDNNIPAQVKRLLSKNSTAVKALKERYYKELVRRLVIRRLLQRKVHQNATLGNESNKNQTKLFSGQDAGGEVEHVVPQIGNSSERQENAAERTTDILQQFFVRSGHQSSHVLGNDMYTTSTVLATDHSTTVLPTEPTYTEATTTVDFYTSEILPIDVDFAMSTETTDIQTTSTTTYTNPSSNSIASLITTENPISEDTTTQNSTLTSAKNHSVHTVDTVHSNVMVNLTREGMQRLLKTLNLIRALKRANIAKEGANKHLITVNIAALRKAYEKLKALRDHNGNASLSETSAGAKPAVTVYTSKGVTYRGEPTTKTPHQEKQVTMGDLGLNGISNPLNQANTLVSTHNVPTPHVQADGRIQHSMKTRNNPLGGKGNHGISQHSFEIPNLRETMDKTPSVRRVGIQGNTKYIHAERITTYEPHNVDMFQDFDHGLDLSFTTFPTRHPLHVKPRFSSQKVSPVVTSTKPTVTMKSTQSPPLGSSRSTTPRNRRLLPHDTDNQNGFQRHLESNKPFLGNIRPIQYTAESKDVPAGVNIGDNNKRRRIIFVRKQNVQSKSNTSPTIASENRQNIEKRTKQNIFKKPMERNLFETQSSTTKQKLQSENQNNAQTLTANGSSLGKKNTFRSDKTHQTSSRSVLRTHRNRGQASKENHRAGQRTNSYQPKQKADKNVSLVRVKSPNKPDKVLLIRHNQNNAGKGRKNIRQILTRIFGRNIFRNNNYHGSPRLNQNFHRLNTAQINPYSYNGMRNGFANHANSAELQEQAAERLEAMEEAFEAGEAGEYEGGQGHYNSRIFKRSTGINHAKHSEKFPYASKTYFGTFS